MSRGLGAIQHRVLDILAAQDKLIDTIELAALAFEVQRNELGQWLVSEAQLDSIRRALRRLRRQGKAIDLGREWRHGRRCWANPATAERYYQRVNMVSGGRVTPRAQNATA